MEGKVQTVEEGDKVGTKKEREQMKRGHQRPLSGSTSAAASPNQNSQPKISTYTKFAQRHHASDHGISGDMSESAQQKGHRKHERTHRGFHHDRQTGGGAAANVASNHSQHGRQNNYRGGSERGRHSGRHHSGRNERGAKMDQIAPSEEYWGNKEIEESFFEEELTDSEHSYCYMEFSNEQKLKSEELNFGESQIQGETGTNLEGASYVKVMEKDIDETAEKPDTLLKDKNNSTSEKSGDGGLDNEVNITTNMPDSERQKLTSGKPIGKNGVLKKKNISKNKGINILQYYSNRKSGTAAKIANKGVEDISAKCYAQNPETKYEKINCNESQSVVINANMLPLYEQNLSQIKVTDIKQGIVALGSKLQEESSDEVENSTCKQTCQAIPMPSNIESTNKERNSEFENVRMYNQSGKLETEAMQQYNETIDLMMEQNKVSNTMTKTLAEELETTIANFNLGECENLLSCSSNTTKDNDVTELTLRPVDYQAALSYSKPTNEESDKLHLCNTVDIKDQLYAVREDVLQGNLIWRHDSSERVNNYSHLSQQNLQHQELPHKVAQHTVKQSVPHNTMQYNAQHPVFYPQQTQASPQNVPQQMLYPQQTQASPQNVPQQILQPVNQQYGPQGSILQQPLQNNIWQNNLQQNLIHQQLWQQWVQQQNVQETPLYMRQYGQDMLQAIVQQNTSKNLFQQRLQQHVLAQNLAQVQVQQNVSCQKMQTEVPVMEPQQTFHKPTHPQSLQHATMPQMGLNQSGQQVTHNITSVHKPISPLQQAPVSSPQLVLNQPVQHGFAQLIPENNTYNIKEEQLQPMVVHLENNSKELTANSNETMNSKITCCAHKTTDDDLYSSNKSESDTSDETNSNQEASDNESDNEFRSVVINANMLPLYEHNSSQIKVTDTKQGIIALDGKLQEESSDEFENSTCKETCQAIPMPSKIESTNKERNCEYENVRTYNQSGKLETEAMQQYNETINLMMEQKKPSVIYKDTQIENIPLSLSKTSILTEPMHEQMDKVSCTMAKTLEEELETMDNFNLGECENQLSCSSNTTKDDGVTEQTLRPLDYKAALSNSKPTNEESDQLHLCNTVDIKDQLYAARKNVSQGNLIWGHDSSENVNHYSRLRQKTLQHREMQHKVAQHILKPSLPHNTMLYKAQHPVLYPQQTQASPQNVPQQGTTQQILQPVNQQYCPQGLILQQPLQNNICQNNLQQDSIHQQLWQQRVPQQNVQETPLYMRQYGQYMLQPVVQQNTFQNLFQQRLQQHALAQNLAQLQVQQNANCQKMQTEVPVMEPQQTFHTHTYPQSLQHVTLPQLGLNHSMQQVTQNVTSVHKPTSPLQQVTVSSPQLVLNQPISPLHQVSSSKIVLNQSSQKLSNLSPHSLHSTLSTHSLHRQQQCEQPSVYLSSHSSIQPSYAHLLPENNTDNIKEQQLQQMVVHSENKSKEFTTNFDETMNSKITPFTHKHETIDDDLYSSNESEPDTSDETNSCQEASDNTDMVKLEIKSCQEPNNSLAEPEKSCIQEIFEQKEPVDHLTDNGLIKNSESDEAVQYEVSIDNGKQKCSFLQRLVVDIDEASSERSNSFHSCISLDSPAIERMNIEEKADENENINSERKGHYSQSTNLFVQPVAGSHNVQAGTSVGVSTLSTGSTYLPNPNMLLGQPVYILQNPPSCIPLQYVKNDQVQMAPQVYPTNAYPYQRTHGVWPPHYPAIYPPTFNNNVVPRLQQMVVSPQVPMQPSVHHQYANPQHAYQNHQYLQQIAMAEISNSVLSSHGAAKTQNKPKFQFEEYWSRDGVQAGLKRGMLIQGTIRINPKNYEDSYVPHPDGVSDVYICGQKNRNRALNGDIVAVLLFPREEWKVMVDDLEHAAGDLQAEFAGLSLNQQVESPAILTTNTDDEDSADVVVEEEYEEMLNSLNNELKAKPPSENLSQHNKNAKKNPKETCDTSEGSAGNQQHQQQRQSSQRTPRKAYTMLKDLGTENHSCSPIVTKLFSKNKQDSGDNSHVQQRLDALPNNLLLRTGKVVYVIEKKHSRACTGHIKLMQDKNSHTALFSPTDHRLPRLLVPIKDCPQGFHERPGDHEKTLFVARITEWEGTGNMARGQLARSLGEAGQIEPETEGILMECGVDYEEFPQQAIDCLPPASNENPWVIPAEEYEKRRDFRKECVFTIDPATARDLDDALHIIDLGNGQYEVGVHIADVSYFVTPKTELDDVAASRTTSVYLVQRVIPMLPRLLCEQLCSLNPDEDRLTFSVVWKMTETGEILDEWFGRSVIRSCAKLAYDHAQGFIEDPDRTWGKDELPPISEGFDSDQIKNKVLILNKIAKNLRQNRYDLGALSLNQVKMQFTLDRESGMPCGYSVYQQRDSNKLIEEFMLLANMAVAHKIYTTFPQVAVLRRHPVPQTRLIEGQVAMLKTMGVDIDCSTSKTLQNSLLEFFGGDMEKRGHFNILTLLFAKTMQLAKYFCTGCVEDDEFYRHYALCVPLYTHFTSPIRRYPDIMVHRLLGAALGYNEVPALDKDEVMSQCALCNDKRINAKVAQELSQEMFFAVFVKDCGPLEEKGVVVKTYDKALDVLFLNLGVVKRIYLEKLPLQNSNFNTEKLACELTLHWKADEHHPKIVLQKLTIFTPVKCVLVASENLKWIALLKHPDDQLVTQEIKSKLPESTFTPDMKISYEDV